MACWVIWSPGHGKVSITGLVYIAGSKNAVLVTRNSILSRIRIEPGVVKRRILGLCERPRVVEPNLNPIMVATNTVIPTRSANHSCGHTYSSKSIDQENSFASAAGIMKSHCLRAYKNREQPNIGRTSKGPIT